MCFICCDDKKCSICNLYIIEIIKDFLDILKEINFKSICMIIGYEYNELKYFCCEKFCCNVVCVYCVVEFYKNYIIKLVKDEYEICKKIMESYCQVVKNKILKVKNILEKLCEKIVFIIQIDVNGKISFREQVIRGINYIIDFENKLKMKVDEKLLKYLNMLKKMEDQVKFFIDNVFECCFILEEVLIGRSFVVFLLVEKILIDKLIDFEKFDIDKLLDIVL